MYLYQKFKSFYFLVIIFSIFFISETLSEQGITISVAAGTEECFYESLKNEQVIDVEYQVIDGGQGALDITFYFESPSGRIIVMDLKRSENDHRIEIEESGDYKFCFDNRFSTFNTKVVYFGLFIQAEDGSDVDPWNIYNKVPALQEDYEIAIQDIEESLIRVKSHLIKVRHLQEIVRNFGTRDKNALEESFFIVNSWSIIQVVIMISVGVIQVIMVKSLFDEKSKMHNIWKKSFS